MKSNAHFKKCINLLSFLNRLTIAKTTNTIKKDDDTRNNILIKIGTILAPLLNNTTFLK